MIRAVTKYGMPVFRYSFFFPERQKVNNLHDIFLSRAEMSWIRQESFSVLYNSREQSIIELICLWNIVVLVDIRKEIHGT